MDRAQTVMTVQEIGDLTDAIPSGVQNHDVHARRRCGSELLEVWYGAFNKHDPLSARNIRDEGFDRSQIVAPTVQLRLVAEERCRTGSHLIIQGPSGVGGGPADRACRGGHGSAGF